MENTTTDKAAAPNIKPSNNKSLTILLTIFFTLLIVVAAQWAWYRYFVKSEYKFDCTEWNQLTSNINQGVNNKQNLESDYLASNEYINGTFGYSFKYPSNFIIKELEGGKRVLVYTPESGPGLDSPTGPEVSVIEKSPEEIVSEWEKSQSEEPGNYFKINSKEDININGRPAIKVDLSTTIGQDIYVLIGKDGITYRIGWDYNNLITPSFNIL